MNVEVEVISEGQLRILFLDRFLRFKMGRDIRGFAAIIGAGVDGLGQGPG